VITIAFFVACVGYVQLCDRIIGPDPSSISDVERAPDEERERTREVLGS
jgi:hypothetical protein